MARNQRFTFLCNQHERELIENLAQRLQRTQSDTIRLLVREAAQQLPTVDAAGTEVSHAPAH